MGEKKEKKEKKQRQHRPIPVSHDPNTAGPRGAFFVGPKTNAPMTRSGYQTGGVQTNTPAQNAAINAARQAKRDAVPQTDKQKRAIAKNAAKKPTEQEIAAARVRKTNQNRLNTIQSRETRDYNRPGGQQMPAKRGPTAKDLQKNMTA